MNTVTTCMTGVEALIRVPPTRGWISPAIFIPIAETSLSASWLMGAAQACQDRQDCPAAFGLRNVFSNPFFTSEGCRPSFNGAGGVQPAPAGSAGITEGFRRFSGDGHMFAALRIWSRLSLTISAPAFVLAFATAPFDRQIDQTFVRAARSGVEERSHHPASRPVPGARLNAGPKDRVY